MQPVAWSSPDPPHHHWNFEQERATLAQLPTLPYAQVRPGILDPLRTENKACSLCSNFSNLKRKQLSKLLLAQHFFYDINWQLLTIWACLGLILQSVIFNTSSVIEKHLRKMNLTFGIVSLSLTEMTEKTNWLFQLISSLTVYSLRKAISTINILLLYYWETKDCWDTE